MKRLAPTAEADAQSPEPLLAQAATYLGDADLATLRRACAFATEAHAEQKRASGDPYIAHPLAVALTLAEMRIDVGALVAAVLHDTVEDTGVLIADIEQEFGAEVAHLVDGVTKLGKMHWLPEDADGEARVPRGEESAWAESLRKMFLAMAEDIRVVLIKLSDRLHNMRTLQYLKPEKQRRIAQETMDIYAPLANRLGIWQIKWQLEDLAFRYLEPEHYKAIARSLELGRRAEREDYIERVVGLLREELERNGIKSEIVGRPKHIYSIYNKMERRGAAIDHIYDLLAVRVLVHEVQECYAALGIVHSVWHPLPGQFDDYIASPKESFYQSLHTTVRGPDGRPLEIQIRTYDMHHVAEYGVAAHWRYKEGGRRDEKFDAKVAWLRQLMDWQKDVVGAQEFVDSLKTDLFQDQVYVFTPKGEIKELPAGATPLDFAYRIHTEVGHRCVGAKVNGRLVALSATLHNGDSVEIVTAKATRGPSRDWLNPALGYLKTASAREKVRQWYRKQQRDESVIRGRELVEKELQRLGVENAVKLEELAHSFRYERVDDFLAAVGYADLNAQQIATKLSTTLAPPAPPAPPPTTPPPTDGSVRGLRVKGVGDLLTRLAQCCNPVPGDAVVGYVTRGRGVTVHRVDCVSILHEDEPERIVDVDWGHVQAQSFRAAIRIEAWDREGLLRDISAVVADEKINIAALNVSTHKDGTATAHATIDIESLAHLSRVMTRLEAIRDVQRVARDQLPSPR